MPPSVVPWLRSWRRWAPVALIPLAWLYLWPLTLHPTWVAFPPGSEFTDLLLSHLPNALYWRDALMHFGQWPLWNGQIYAGLPFAADPLAGLWYPPALALLVLPLPFGFNFLLGLHLAWAGYGLFRFLRLEGLGALASGLGAVALVGTPKLVAHLGAGHVSLVFAVAWTPWLLLALRRASQVDGGVTVWRVAGRGAMAGAIMALLFLADVRWAYYAGLLALAYAVTMVRQFPLRWRLAAGLAFGLFFLLLSAVLALPLAEFVQLASRSALTVADGGLYSLPPRYLVGLLIPNLRGFHEWMTYLGFVPLLLAVAGLGRQTWFWALVALVAAVYSLGTNAAFFPIVFRVLPLASLLRVPPRAWFLVALAVCILASHGLQRLLDVALPYLARRYAGRRVWLPSATALAASLMMLTVLDLVRVDGTLLDVRPVPVAPVTTWLQQQPGLFRVYSPTFSLPYGDGLQHVDGVDPLQLTSALAIIEPAIGVYAQGYKEVVPGYDSSDIAHAMLTEQPNAARLARLDVKYVASRYELTDARFQYLTSENGVLVYTNLAWSGRAWIEAADTAAATVTSWTPNRLDVHATGPGRLVVSEIAYPGWVARVDGEPAAVEAAEGALRAVELAPGPHQIVFEFRPLSVYLGGALSVLGLIGLAVVLWPRPTS